MRRIYVDPWRNDTRPREYSQYFDTEILYEVDFSDAATDKGASVSSVSWTSVSGPVLTVTATSVSSGVASGTVSGDSRGLALLKVEATYDDASTEKAYLFIRIEDPE